MAEDLKERLTIRLPKTYLTLLEQLVGEGIYNSKDEAIRDVLHQLFEHFGIFHLEEKKDG